MMDAPEGPLPRMEEGRKRRNREHTNSKYGCAQCKARKVKCDESKPKCRSCTRRATQCHYPYGPPNTSNGLHELARLATSSPHSSSTSYSNVYHSHHSLHVPDDDYHQSQDRQTNHQASGGSPYPSRVSPQSTSSYVPQPQIDPLEVNLAHIELFHHFTSSTAATITAGPSTEKLWSITIPRIALSHRFLMHSILAISALDISNSNHSHSTAYYEQATAHEDRALAMAQADIANPSAGNADALFAFILTTVFYAFASPEPPISSDSPFRGEDRPKPLHGAVQCINLLRGLRSVMSSIKGWVETGPLAPLLNMQSSSASPPHRFRDHGAEEHWSNLLLFASTTSTAGPKELEDIEIYSAAASLLRASSQKVDGSFEGESNPPHMWQWAARLPEEFVDRLAHLDAVPLVLVAHWCVLLQQTQHGWWIHQWVNRTMREITAVLPEKCKPWLDWPLERLETTRGTGKEVESGRMLSRQEGMKARKRSEEKDASMIE